MSFLEFIYEAREELCYIGTLYISICLAVILLDRYYSSKKKMNRKHIKK